MPENLDPPLDFSLDSSPAPSLQLNFEPLAPKHLPFLWRLHSDPRTFELDAVPPLDAVDQMQQILAEWIQAAQTDGFGYFLISLGSKPLGVAGFNAMELNFRRVANAYVRLIPAAWQKGVAFAALNFALSELRKKLRSNLRTELRSNLGTNLHSKLQKHTSQATPPLQEAVFLTGAKNLPAQKLAEKLGFKLTTEQDSMEPEPHLVYTLPLVPTAGRYAPSPSGDLHLGNIRTAILAWVLARQSGRRFLMRIEDVDTQRSSEDHARRQLEDLGSVGLNCDEILVQSQNSELYQQVLTALAERDLTYECYCTRKEILEAPRAPHAPPGAYPGTCRNLSQAEREMGRKRMINLQRKPAIRLKAQVNEYSAVDYFAGKVTTEVDDFVLRRGDGLWAYNLAAVVDDLHTGVDQVVRADDLLPSTPRQAYLMDLVSEVLPQLVHVALRVKVPPGGKLSQQVQYVHVPLAVNHAGARLAKRNGAVTLRERLALGESIADVTSAIAVSLGLPPLTSASEIFEWFNLKELPHKPWIVAG